MYQPNLKTSLVALFSLGLAACSSGVPGSENTEGAQQELAAGDGVTAEGESASAPRRGPPPHAMSPDGTPHRGRPPHGPPPSPEALLERLDADKSGSLERAEIPEFLASADADADGRLSLAELRGHKEKMHAERFAHTDANKDGALTQPELGEHRWSRMSLADSDKDGKLTRAELDKAHAEGKLHPMKGGDGFRPKFGPPPPEVTPSKP